MAEMYTHPQPLFCGANEKEVLFRICSVLGTPTHDVWNDGIRQANIVGIKFPTCPGNDLEKIIPEASSEAIDMIKSMIKWDPNKRATAKNLFLLIILLIIIFIRVEIMILFSEKIISKNLVIVMKEEEKMKLKNMIKRVIIISVVIMKVEMIIILIILE